MNPNLIPVLPESAPFTPEQRAWLNGFLAGILSRAPAPGAANPEIQATPLQPLTILFGSQTGTAETLAKRVAKEAGRRGFAATVLEMSQTEPAKLAAEKNLLLITSTYGDGEPPDNAKVLHARLKAEAGGRTTDFANVRFSVCALGDTNYVQFCKCGHDFDAFLEGRGATRVSARVECDLDYEAKFAGWMDAALAALRNAECGMRSGDPRPMPEVNPIRTESAIRSPQSEMNEHGRRNPFPALLLVSRKLSGEGSAKQVQHVEFSLENSGLAYEAGDALAVLPQNCPDLVGDFLGVLGCDGEEAVPAPDGGTVPLRRALTELYDLGRPSSDLLAHFGGADGGGVAVAQLQVIDLLLTRADVKLAPEVFVRALRKLQPRLYSISSSPKAHPGAVHLTVGTVRYEKDGRLRKGVCSTFLADRATPGASRIGVFVHGNKSFRPPADGATPMIMVGPGTGIAPFRAFLEERQATGAKGRNWLIFGDQREATDFLYREQLREAEATGVLTRMDLAWSRDQADKRYVQHLLQENAAEVFAWLEQGAHFYVCGDASRMAKDVDAALHRIVETAGGRSADAAAAYIQALKTAKRYCRDVY